MEETIEQKNLHTVLKTIINKFFIFKISDFFDTYIIQKKYAIDFFFLLIRAGHTRARGPEFSLFHSLQVHNRFCVFGKRNKVRKLEDGGKIFKIKTGTNYELLLV